MWILVCLLILTLVASPEAGRAQGVTDAIIASKQAWHATDDCARDSLKKFPDHTPESNAKREAFRRTCLRNHKIAAPDTPIDALGAH